MFCCFKNLFFRFFDSLKQLETLTTKRKTNNDEVNMGKRESIRSSSGTAPVRQRNSKPNSVATESR